MTTLALRSLRHRASSSTAAFASIALGTFIIGTFATLIETATGQMSSADRQTLVTIGAVVGSWGVLIVLFSVASTLGVTVRQRESEIGMLRSIGATPRQVRTLIRSEAVFIALIASALGAIFAAGAGRALLSLLKRRDLIATSVAGKTGWVALSIVFVIMIIVSAVAASVAGRRATRSSIKLLARRAANDRSKMRWYRILAAVVFIMYGVVLGIVTITVTAKSDDPYAAMATSGSSSILVGIGFALLSPVLLGTVAGLASPILARFGAPGHLARFSVVRRRRMLAGVLGPVIVLTATAVGTLMLVGIDGRTLDRSALQDDTSGSVNLLNNVVVIMIALFAAIMVINSFAAVFSDRREEFRRLRLIGGDAEQLSSSVMLEAVVVAGVGVLYGSVASLATIIPFGVARDEGVIPDGQLVLPLLVIVGVVGLTFGSAKVAFIRLGMSPDRRHLVIGARV
ncbi:ABC transporter permease [Aeromicrobium sp. 9AM]|uniref:ABC transporter permease n=1 Tax=Aeromicrobium sp. 9AM TaxID=2653126 RepID=UPI0012F001A1|nr:ABC transporter permease [Aeromicrobium sp. 9AM]VXB08200.1 conserved membrane hypothetical protein [Aeromicrobium sp. 9AM]